MDQGGKTCPKCSRMFQTGDTVRFGRGRPSHLDCHRPHTLSTEERALLFLFCREHLLGECPKCSGKYWLPTPPSDLIGVGPTLCRWCQEDVTDSIRTHLYDCATLPAEVRRRAQQARETAQRLVKRSQELTSAADVLIREAEVAVAALWEILRHPPARAARAAPPSSRSSASDDESAPTAGAG
jgi:hypothetical protein